MRTYACDMETTTKRDDCRPYAIGIQEVGVDEGFVYVRDLDEFFGYMSQFKKTKTYFHNLKFDGTFILDWLLIKGFNYVATRKELWEDYTFTCLIDGMNNFFTMEIHFYQGKKMVVYDSLKLINMRLSEMSKSFGISEVKLGRTYDYHKERPVGYILDSAEEKYLENDCVILAKSLNFMFEQGMNKMTIASCSLTEFKKTHSSREYKAMFPNSNSWDSYIRKSYKGGFTFLNHIYKDKTIRDLIVLDVNSLYPSVMYSKPLPWGDPIFYEGRYKRNKEYPLYVQRLLCNFVVRDGMLPTIQLKNFDGFNSTEYLESSKAEVVELTLTSIDLKMFMRHYEVTEITYLDGYMFKQSDKIFVEFIDKWTNIKIKAGKEKNSGMYTLSKLMLNSLYGKFGTNPEVFGKIPYLDEDGIVRLRLVEGKDRDAMYVAMASFITSYAREITIETSQKVRNYSMEKYGIDKYIYSDTDSIHCGLTIEEVSEFLHIDKFELGAWDYEAKFKKGKYIRAKTYIQSNGKPKFNIGKSTDKIKNSKGTPRKFNIEYVRKFRDIMVEDISVTVAGMPTTCHKYVTFENFKEGTSYYGKKLGTRVKGGTVIEDTDYTIKKSKE